MGGWAGGLLGPRQGALSRPPEATAVAHRTICPPHLRRICAASAPHLRRTCASSLRAELLHLVLELRQPRLRLRVRQLELDEPGHVLVRVGLGLGLGSG